MFWSRKKFGSNLDDCEAFKTDDDSRIDNMIELEDIGRSIWASMMDDMEINNQREISINQIIRNM